MSWHAAPVLGVPSGAEAAACFEKVVGFECQGGLYGADAWLVPG